MTLALSSGDRYAGTLAWSLGPVKVTSIPKPAVPLETGGFSMAMNYGEIKSKVSEIYGSQSASSPKLTANGGSSFLGFDDKNQAFLPRRYTDEDHVREILTVGMLNSTEDDQREPTWLMRIWAPKPSAAPTGKATLASIIEKYGSPSIRQRYEGRGNDPDDTELQWHFDQTGKLLTGKPAQACQYRQEYKQSETPTALSMTRGWEREVARINTGVGQVAIRAGCGYSIIVIIDTQGAGQLYQLTVAFYNHPRLLATAWQNLRTNVQASAEAVLKAHAQAEGNKPKL